jgi:(1->4)-alpha-D-glucan 1-alpha-D-glucosylmutase
VAAAVADVVAGHRCAPDCPDACGRMDALLDAQAYRLCFWRVASDEINYRRFFDVNELSALAAEREDVFRATHDLVLRLCAEGLVDGLRVDHPDGLFDPKQYLDRLQARYREVTGRDGEPLYVVVEKILESAEQLPADWATAGTTGYDALNAINGLFVDPAGAADLTRAYIAFTGRDDPFDQVVYRQKALVTWTAFSSELEMLARQLDRLARKNRRARDLTLNGLRWALRAVIACFPVYRSYVTDHVTTTDAARIVRAVRLARRRSPTTSPELFDFIRDTLLLRPPPDGADPDYAADQRRFAGKFQQVTAPVTAKGVEDTAFYRYNRLASVNEVGGDPDRLGRSAKDVHRFFADRQAKHPGGLTALATHDTKRGEDTRARINVLSELAPEWSRRAARWAELNRRHRIELEDGLFAPDPNDEYLLYQTLVGAWPDDFDDPAGRERFTVRVKEYLRKAIHEAKEHTSWINPNPEYDAGVQEFVGRALDPEAAGAFLTDLREFAGTVARVGVTNSLAQSLLRCTVPGVPDTYQGTELWDLSLVDPDNRRPVDYGRQAGLLRELDAGAEVGNLLNQPDGRAKLYVVCRALRYRRSHPELFRDGEYLPMDVTGPAADHVFAFARRLGSRAVLVAVPRLMADWSGVWAGTGVALVEGLPSRWTNLFTGEEVGADGSGVLAVGQAFARFPVALLEGK